MVLAEAPDPWSVASVLLLSWVVDAVPPAALVAACLMALSLAADAWLARRFAGGDGGADGGSCWALVVSLSTWMLLGLALAPWPAWRLPGLGLARGLAHGPAWGWDGGAWTAWLWWGPGLVLACAGLALRYAAIASLGDAFTWRVASHSPHPLKRDGLYAWVRHPSYLGGLLAGLGLLCLCGAWPALVGFAVVHGGVVSWRIRREEEALAAAHGEAWLSYAKGVPALWPWRPGGAR